MDIFYYCAAFLLIGFWAGVGIHLGFTSSVLMMKLMDIAGNKVVNIFNKYKGK